MTTFFSLKHHPLYFYRAILVYSTENRHFFIHDSLRTFLCHLPFLFLSSMPSPPSLLLLSLYCVSSSPTSISLLLPFILLSAVFAVCAVIATALAQIFTNTYQKSLDCNAMQLLYHTSPLIALVRFKLNMQYCNPCFLPFLSVLYRFF